MRTSLHLRITGNLTPTKNMQLLSVQYFEYPNSPKEWTLEKTVLQPSNLIVGKNATGKSRFAKIIWGLSRLLTGDQRDLYGTAHYQIELEIDNRHFNYKLDIEKKAIQSESLTVDGVEKFSRNHDGAGEIYAEELGRNVKFEVESNVLIAQAKIDSIQHPYLLALKNWAAGVRLFEFGTEFGRNQLLLQPGNIDAHGKFLESNANPQFPSTVGILQKGIIEYKDKFKKAVLKDLAAFGYQCTDIGLGQIPDIESSQPLFGIYIVEKELGFQNFQIQLSTGLFRALALMAYINYLSISQHDGLILIDDIGEGLDFERASAVVKTLLTKAGKTNLQIVMTSNDRFIMNAVPLNIWTVLDRQKGKVRAFNSVNANKAFQEFRLLGLNNFDFFATRSYKQSKSIK